jgi:hypothetical protein
MDKALHSRLGCVGASHSGGLRTAKAQSPKLTQSSRGKFRTSSTTMAISGSVCIVSGVQRLVERWRRKSGICRERHFEASPGRCRSGASTRSLPRSTAPLPLVLPCDAPVLAKDDAPSVQSRARGPEPEGGTGPRSVKVPDCAWMRGDTCGAHDVVRAMLLAPRSHLRPPTTCLR